MSYIFNPPKSGGVTPVAGTNAFSYYLLNTTGGVTGDGVQYTILCDTALVPSTNYNAGTGQYTAPATGVYIFQSVIIVNVGDADATYGQMVLATTAHAYTSTIGNPFAGQSAIGAEWGFSFSQTVPMTAGDTAAMQILIIGSAGNTSTIQGSAGGGTVFTMFSGFQVA